MYTFNHTTCILIDVTNIFSFLFHPEDFDAFVSYSHHDGPWVYQQLRPYLEDEEPAFRLCIHERDFMAGAAIAENIACGLKTSRRMILVLSKAFLRSDWCHHEFRQAHYKVWRLQVIYNHVK